MRWRDLLLVSAWCAALPRLGVELAAPRRGAPTPGARRRAPHRWGEEPILHPARSRCDPTTEVLASTAGRPTRVRISASHPELPHAIRGSARWTIDLSNGHRPESLELVTPEGSVHHRCTYSAYQPIADGNWRPSRIVEERFAPGSSAFVQIVTTQILSGIGLPLDELGELPRGVARRCGRARLPQVLRHRTAAGRARGSRARRLRDAQVRRCQLRMSVGVGIAAPRYSVGDHRTCGCFVAGRADAVDLLLLPPPCVTVVGRRGDARAPAPRRATLASCAPSQVLQQVDSDRDEELFARSGCEARAHAVAHVEIPCTSGAAMEDPAELSAGMGEIDAGRG